MALEVPHRVERLPRRRSAADADPKVHPNAQLIPRIGVAELRARNLETLPFDEVLLDLLSRARLVKSFQIVNGLHPERLAQALAGEHVGSIVHAD